MANSQIDIELISHCIEFMSSKDDVKEIFDSHELRFAKSNNYKELATKFERKPNSISLSDITTYFRSHWTPCDIDRHIANLKTGKLAGHNWHGAMPSNLHLSIQERVRECGKGLLSLDDFLSIGSDIFKHEYFMTATHDICESSIILSSDTIIPPIGSKSITDFIYNKTPYDLKVSSHPDAWKDKAGRLSIDEKKQLAIELYEGADTDRMRADADKCKNNWGLNRMYFLVSDQNKWITEPEAILQFLLEQLQNADNYFQITVNGFTMQICLIEQ